MTRDGGAGTVRVDVHDWRNIRTNPKFNPCRQRSWSSEMACAMAAAECVGEGDLEDIGRAFRTGRYPGVKVTPGDYEPQSERVDGCSWDSALEWSRHTVRLSCGFGRRAAWVEVIYQDVDDAERVLSAAGWQPEPEGAELYSDIPF